MAKKKEDGVGKVAEVTKVAEVAEEETPATSATPETPETPETAETPAPGADDMDDEVMLKSNFFKIRIKNFRGTFSDAVFDDNGMCERISESTLRQLIDQFPNADFEEHQEL